MKSIFRLALAGALAQHPVRFSCWSNKTLFTADDPVAAQPGFTTHPLVRTKHHISALSDQACINISTVGPSLKSLVHQVLNLGPGTGRRGRGRTSAAIPLPARVCRLGWKREGGSGSPIGSHLDRSHLH